MLPRLGGTSITLAIRSPEQPQQRPLVRGPLGCRSPYLHSLGIGGGEADGTAVMEGGQATVVYPI
jgi:hypothetical protein